MPTYVKVVETMERVARSLQAKNDNALIAGNELVRQVVKECRCEKTSVLPADHCYNRYNKGSHAVQLFEHVGEVRSGTYRYLGRGHPYTGPIWHYPKGGTKQKVGSWKQGIVTWVGEAPRLRGGPVPSPGTNPKSVTDATRNELNKRQAAQIKVSDELLAQGGSGAGFGNSADNKAVEEAAINLVTTKYRADGWKVRTVESKRCGFDLVCRKDQITAHVEVKGVRGTKQSFIITSGEVRQAAANAKFVLIVVTSALSHTPVLHRYQGAEFARHFRLNPLQYLAVLSK